MSRGRYITDSGLVEGMKIHNLTFIKEVDPVYKPQEGKADRLYRRALCKCSCGNEKEICLDNFRRGKIESCGCVQKAAVRDNTLTHGLSKSPEYKVYMGMKGRCHNPSHVDYHNYGARGISVCEHWRGSFNNFIEDMGERPSDIHTIERVDNNGNYSPDNCVWLLRELQNCNKRKYKKRIKQE